MSRGLFITATGTDIGKTYVSALIAKRLKQDGYNCGYYKAAASGSSELSRSDAGFVNQSADEIGMVSFLYETPVSPHLASQIEGNPVRMDRILRDYKKICEKYDLIITEGSGGIVCPIRWDEEAQILLEDIVLKLSLPTIIVADAGLGTINATVLTTHYLKSRGIPTVGIVVNRFQSNRMTEDNIKMIEAITGIPVIAKVGLNANSFGMPGESLEKLFG